MTQINTFSDRDSEGIAAVVRRVENKVSVPFEKRPPPLPADSDGANSFVYEITGSIVLGSPTTAKVTIYSKDDESTVIATNQDWIGNLTMFDEQGVGDRGICIKVGAVYVAQNAPCSGGAAAIGTNRRFVQKSQLAATSDQEGAVEPCWTMARISAFHFAGERQRSPSRRSDRAIVKTHRSAA